LLVEGGREVLFFVPSSIVLVARCLLGVSRVSCLVRERDSYLHLFGLDSFAWIISLSL